MEITMFSKPACTQCRATEKTLQRLGLEYEKVDVTQDMEAYRRAAGHGFTAMPIVEIVQDGEVVAAWSGYRDTHLRQLAGGKDPHALDERAPAQETGQDSEADTDQGDAARGLNTATPGGAVVG